MLWEECYPKQSWQQETQKTGLNSLLPFFVSPVVIVVLFVTLRMAKERTTHLSERKKMSGRISSPMMTRGEKEEDAEALISLPSRNPDGINDLSRSWHQVLEYQYMPRPVSASSQQWMDDFINKNREVDKDPPALPMTSHPAPWL